MIVKPSALGDVVHSLPFLNALKDRFPEASIHWVIAGGFHEVLQGHPLIDRLWVIDKEQWKRPSKMRETFSGLRELFAALGRERFDLVVDLQGLLRSGIIAFASGCPQRIGFQEAREGSRFFYTHRVRGGRNIHAVDRYLKVAEFLGCDIRHPIFSFPSLGALPASLFPMHSPFREYAVMAPSAGSEVKRWPAERLGWLASKLPFPSLVVAGREDVHLAQEVVAASKGKAVSLAGRTSLKQLAALIRDARFLVSADTGPIHIAAALNVPVFAVFGPTNPVRTGPYGTLHTFFRADLPCSPCYRRKKCGDWRCMTAVSAEEVLATLREHVEDRPPHA